MADPVTHLLENTRNPLIKLGLRRVIRWIILGQRY